MNIEFKRSKMVAIASHAESIQRQFRMVKGNSNEDQGLLQALDKLVDMIEEEMANRATIAQTVQHIANRI